MKAHLNSFGECLLSRYKEHELGILAISEERVTAFANPSSVKLSFKFAFQILTFMRDLGKAVTSLFLQIRFPIHVLCSDSINIPQKSSDAPSLVNASSLLDIPNKDMPVDLK